MRSAPLPAIDSGLSSSSSSLPATTSSSSSPSLSWQEREYAAPYLSPSIVSSSASCLPTPELCCSFDSVQSELVRFSYPSLWSPPIIDSRDHDRVYPNYDTSAQIVWNEEGLHVLYRLNGPFELARDDPTNKMSILNDSRVEVHIDIDIDIDP